MNMVWLHGERMPVEAQILGGSGLLPLFAAVVLTFVVPQPFGFPMARAGVVYSAIILSFLGGVHWGFASSALARDPKELDAPRLLGFSVLPMLAAWGAIFLSDRVAATILAFAFIAVLLLDRLSERLGYGPRWWLRFRAALTTGMVVLLLLLAMAAPRT